MRVKIVPKLTSNATTERSLNFFTLPGPIIDPAIEREREDVTEKRILLEVVEHGQLYIKFPQLPRVARNLLLHARTSRAGGGVYFRREACLAKSLHGKFVYRG